MWALTTNNPNVMKSARNKLMETKKAKWIAYGCTPHSLDKFSHNLLKMEPFKSNHESTMTLVSYFNQTLRSRAVLSKLQKESREKVWAIKTFSPT